MIYTYFIQKRPIGGWDSGWEGYIYQPCIIAWIPSQWSGLRWFGENLVKKRELIRSGTYLLDKTKNYSTPEAALHYIRKQYQSTPHWEKPNCLGFTVRLSLRFEDSEHVSLDKVEEAWNVKNSSPK